MVDSLPRPRLTAPDPGALRHGGGRLGRLGRHVAALAVLLVALLPLMAPRSAMTSDEGAYALQVKALQAGSWKYDYRAAELDPDGEHAPVTNVHRSDDDFFSYIQHPAYARLLQSAVMALGETMGLHFWPLVGAIGIAIAAWLLAGEVDPRLRPAAFWLAAAGPALANAYAVWAHTLSGAVAGLTLVAAVRVARHGATPARLVAISAGLATGVLIRSEGLLYAGAVVVVLAVTTRRARFLLLALAPVAAVLGERLWVRRIAGGAYDNLSARGDGSGFLAGRITGLWHDLFQASALGVVALVAVVALGMMALRRWDPRSSPQALVVMAAAGSLLAFAQYVALPSELVPGLFAACPVLLLGLVLAPRVRVLTPTVALFALAVVATEYAGGGGAEWGGRFFSPLLAPLAVLAVHGLDRRLAAARHPTAELVTVERAATRPTVTSSHRALTALAALTAVGAVVSLLTVAQVRRDHSQHVAAVLRHPAQVVVTTSPALPNVAWTTHDDVTWMATTRPELADLLASLRAENVKTVTVIADQVTSKDALRAYADVQEAPEPTLNRVGLTVFSLRQ